MRNNWSVIAAVLVTACVSSADAQTQPQANPRQAQITIKAVGVTRLDLRVNGADVGELTKHEPYVGTVPAGKVIVSVHQKWKLGWKSIRFTAVANKPNTLYLRAGEVYRMRRHCLFVNDAVRRGKTGPWIKNDPFFRQDITRCKRESSTLSPEITTSQ